MIVKALALFFGAAHYRAKQLEREAEELYARKRLLGVIERARVVSLAGNRFACGMGPDGPLWPEQVRAIVNLGQRIVEQEQ